MRVLMIEVDCGEKYCEKCSLMDDEQCYLFGKPLENLLLPGGDGHNWQCYRLTDCLESERIATEG
jgi:hypothetical protein